MPPPEGKIDKPSLLSLFFFELVLAHVSVFLPLLGRLSPFPVKRTPFTHREGTFLFFFPNADNFRKGVTLRCNSSPPPSYNKLFSRSRTRDSSPPPPMRRIHQRRPGVIPFGFMPTSLPCTKRHLFGQRIQNIFFFFKLLAFTPFEAFSIDLFPSSFLSTFRVSFFFQGLQKPSLFYFERDGILRPPLYPLVRDEPELFETS